METPTHRYPWLDALRGYAAAAVLYLHGSDFLQSSGLAIAPWEQTLFWLFTDVFDLGKIGVAVFFAVSGFVIPYTLFKHPHWQQGLRVFIVNRFFRLYPAYWLSVLLAVVLLYLLGKPLVSITILGNFTMLQQFVGIENLQGLYWTLQIELIFYGLCAGMFAVGWRGGIRSTSAITAFMLLVALGMALARGWFQLKLPVAIPLALTLMFWGTVWRAWVIERNPLAKRLGSWLCGAFFLIIPVISYWAYNTDFGHQETWYRYCLSYMAAMAILLIFTSRIKLNDWFSSWLGRISYSFYLFHALVAQLVVLVFVKNWQIALPAHVYLALMFLGTVAFSHYVYVWLEKPGIAFAKRINRKYNET